MIAPPPMILCFGEFLWDLFPEGERLGGAPSNVAYHLSQLNCVGKLISSVGEDDEGMRALVELRDQGVDVSLVSVNEQLETGFSKITISDNGDASYEIALNSAWEEMKFCETQNSEIQEARAIMFTSMGISSDNNQTVLAGLIQQLDQDAKVVFDINLRKGFENRDTITTWLKRAHWLKCNREEAMWLLNQDSTLSVNEIIEHLKKLSDFEAIILTLDKDGAAFWSKEEESISLAPPQELDDDIIDTVGAGDACLAVILEGFCRHRDCDETLNKSVKIATFVTRQIGATPNYTDDMINLIN